jgi:hypothetical protein
LTAVRAPCTGVGKPAGQPLKGMNTPPRPRMGTASSTDPDGGGASGLLERRAQSEQREQRRADTAESREDDQYPGHGQGST